MKISSFLKKIGISAFRLICPKQCLACAEILDNNCNDKLCSICKTKWESAKSALRDKMCGTPSIPIIVEGFDHIQSGVVSSLCEYKAHHSTGGYDVQRKLIFSLKRNAYCELTDFVTDELYQLICEVLGGYKNDKQTVIVSMPRNRINRIRDGVDNMKTVGKKLAKKLDITYYPALEQQPGVKEQKRLTAKGREKNMKNNLYIKRRYIDKFKNKRVIIIDDVVTTGAGARSAAHELLSNGEAKQIMFFSITMNPQNLMRALS